jgi:hypothetical protein
VNGEKLQLIKEKTIWIQKEGNETLDPNLYKRWAGLYRYG